MQLLRNNGGYRSTGVVGRLELKMMGNSQDSDAILERKIHI
jgi:hypothetical protein